MQTSCRGDFIAVIDDELAHAPFWDLDIPAMMISDTSEFRYPRYHCAGGPDTVANLDHDFSAMVVQATVGAAASSLGLP